MKTPTLKSFFNNDTTYNEAGAKLILDLDTTMEKIFQDAMAQGYNTREISPLVMDAAAKASSKYSITISENMYKEKRAAIIASSAIA